MQYFNELQDSVCIKLTAAMMAMAIVDTITAMISTAAEPESWGTASPTCDLFIEPGRKKHTC